MNSELGGEQGCVGNAGGIARQWTGVSLRIQ